MSWVVVVDDDQENRARVSSILEKEGLKVTGLGGGEELLNYIEGMIPLPDLILLDLIMPGLNGFDTLKLLRKKTGAENEIPVIFLTGDEEKQKDWSWGRSTL